MIFNRKRAPGVAAALLMALGLAASAADWQWKVAAPDYPWSFPRDHWAHPAFKTEWWYLTGQLASKGRPQRRFGYQFTFFRIGLRPASPDFDSQWASGALVMGHAALSDLDQGRHLFSEVLYRAVPLLGGFSRPFEPRIGWSRAPAGTDSNWTLHWNGQAFDLQMRDEERHFAFQLSTRPLKPLIFQGPGGLSRKGRSPTAASHYYSFTRLGTEGTVEWQGRTFQVEGESWMDKEFGSNQLAENQVGWDWFSLQLDSGRELMLYHLRDRSGVVDFAHGTWIGRRGQLRYLEQGEWRVETLSRWTSPQSGARYPAGWLVSLPAEALQMLVLPEFAEQENRSELLPQLYYWEGAVRIQTSGGRPLGRGYVELTGYGEDSRPPV